MIFPSTRDTACDVSQPAHAKRLASTFGIELDFKRLDVREQRYILDHASDFIAKHKVVVIRNADLNPAQIHALGVSMGMPLKYAFSNGVEGFPELVEIRRTPQQVTALSTMWHSDSTYLASPPDVTVLYGVEIPPFGGTTLFADTAAAFADLSPTMRDLLRRLRVVQRSDVHAVNERLAHLSKPVAQETALSAVHDAICRSDDLESIYVSQEHTAHFEGMSREESKPLLDFLMRHIVADKYRLEITWQPHTLVISDNRKTQHRAIDNYYGHSRTLLRLIVQLTKRDPTQSDTKLPLALAA